MKVTVNVDIYTYRYTLVNLKIYGSKIIFNGKITAFECVCDPFQMANLYEKQINKMNMSQIMAMCEK